MTRLACRSFAKINLHLQVVGRRSDGYHELRTVFQTIDLHDRVTVEIVAGGAIDLAVDAPGLAAGPENLAWRAAAAFRERWAPGLGIRLSLSKRIPVGGGLGGGSGNAATVLLALRALTGSPAALADLWEAARELGADVPYFLIGGTALGVGRGDEIVLLPDLPPEDVWLVVPPLSISTRDVFAAVEAPSTVALAPAVRALALGAALSGPLDLEGWNDLQEPVFRRFPGMREVYTLVRDAGASPVRLSGSGAALFARLGEGEAAALRRRLSPEIRFERVRTLTRTGVEAGRFVG